MTTVVAKAQDQPDQSSFTFFLTNLLRCKQAMDMLPPCFNKEPKYDKKNHYDMWMLYIFKKQQLTSTFPGHSGKWLSLGTSHWLVVPSLTAGEKKTVFVFS